MAPPTRTCNICGETKPLDDFPMTGRWHLKKCRTCWQSNWRRYNMAKSTRLRRFIHDCKRKSERMSGLSISQKNFWKNYSKNRKGLPPITGFRDNIGGHTRVLILNASPPPSTELTAVKVTRKTMSGLSHSKQTI